MNSYLDLSYWQVGLAAGLMLINGLLSVWLRLNLNRSLLIASLRTVVQLSLMGLVLHVVFALERWYWVILLLSLMTLSAGFVSVERCKVRYAGMHRDSILSISTSSWLVAGVAIFGILVVEPWYRPQYTVPIMGMILGNALTGVSLGLDRFTQGLVDRRAEIEGLLALGASRWEAARPMVVEGVRAAMIPTLNAMAAVGIVSLPGMMTGQILAGVDPASAVKYQIVIMFLLASATALGSVTAVMMAYRRIFSPDHQFLYGLLKSRS